MKLSTSEQDKVILVFGIVGCAVVLYFCSSNHDTTVFVEGIIETLLGALVMMMRGAPPAPPVDPPKQP
jgi:hypothetical protein